MRLRSTALKQGRGDSDGSHGVGVDVIVGAVLGSVLGCCLLACCAAVLCWRPRELKQQQQQLQKVETAQKPHSPSSEVAGGGSLGLSVGGDDVKTSGGSDAVKRELYLTHHATVGSVQEEAMVRQQFETALALVETSQRLASRDRLQGSELLAEPPSRSRSRSAPGGISPTQQRRKFHFSDAHAWATKRRFRRRTHGLPNGVSAGARWNHRACVETARTAE